MESTDPKLNRGFEKRADLISGSRIVTTNSKLDVPMFQSGKSFPPNTRFSLSLEHASDDYRLHCKELNNKFKFEIVDITLETKRANVRPEISLKIFSEFDRQGYIDYYASSFQLCGPAHVQVRKQTLI